MIPTSCSQLEVHGMDGSDLTLGYPVLAVSGLIKERDFPNYVCCLYTFSVLWISVGLSIAESIGVS